MGFAWVICTKKKTLLATSNTVAVFSDRGRGILYVHLKVILSLKKEWKYCVYSVQCYKCDGLYGHRAHHRELIQHIYLKETKALTTLKNDIYCLFGEVVVCLKLVSLSWPFSFLLHHPFPLPVVVFFCFVFHFSSLLHWFIVHPSSVGIWLRWCHSFCSSFCPSVCLSEVHLAAYRADLMVFIFTSASYPYMFPFPCVLIFFCVGSTSLKWLFVSKWVTICLIQNLSICQFPSLPNPSVFFFFFSFLNLSLLHLVFALPLDAPSHPSLLCTFIFPLFRSTLTGCNWTYIVCQLYLVCVTFLIDTITEMIIMLVIMKIIF